MCECEMDTKIGVCVQECRGLCDFVVEMAGMAVYASMMAVSLARGKRIPDTCLRFNRGAVLEL